MTEYDEVEPACTTVRTIDPVMNHSECKTIVPILTVMVDYGNEPPRVSWRPVGLSQAATVVA